MASPRLPPRIEHQVLRVACGLPPGAQRALFGRPPEVDGQQLAPDMQALLRVAAIAGDSSASKEGRRSPAQARAHLRAGAGAVADRRSDSLAVNDLAIPGPAGMIPARFYEPPGLGLERRPLIVYFHGGGWTIGDLETCDGVCRLLARETPATVLSVEYRLAPEHPFPAAVDDALAAFRWAAVDNERLGVDPARIAVAGDSAGGNLAAVVSLLARDEGGPLPAMQALIYPVADVAGRHASRDFFAHGFLLTRADMEWFERHYLPSGADRADPRVSVLGADLSGLPPTYLATAGFDPLRDEGEALAAALREAGVAVTLRRHPGLIHGFANMARVSRTARGAMRELTTALGAGLS